LDLILDFNYFSFSNCNINPHPTHLAKHQILSPNHQFSKRIWYGECCSVHEHMAWSQKFRKSEISLDTGDSASNTVVKRSVCLLLLTSVLQNVCLCTMDFESAGKNTLLLLYVTVCEKVVPRLNKHDDVIEWNFVKIAPPRNEELVAPLLNMQVSFQFVVFTWWFPKGVSKTSYKVQLPCLKILFQDINPCAVVPIPPIFSLICWCSVEQESFPI